MQTWIQKITSRVYGPKTGTCPLKSQDKGETISTCRSKGPNGELIERTCDHVIASQSLQVRIKNMGVDEDFESRPHKVTSDAGFEDATSHSSIDGGQIPEKKQ